jgi:hypothetical protein
MTTLNMKREADAKPAEFSDEPQAAADRGVHGQVHGPVQGPMSQQSTFGAHGYDIHPQKFVRLVGCQPLQRTAA